MPRRNRINSFYVPKSPLAFQNNRWLSWLASTGQRSDWNSSSKPASPVIAHFHKSFGPAQCHPPNYLNPLKLAMYSRGKNRAKHMRRMEGNANRRCSPIPPGFWKLVFCCFYFLSGNNPVVRFIYKRNGLGKVVLIFFPYIFKVQSLV